MFHFIIRFHTFLFFLNSFIIWHNPGCSYPRSLNIGRGLFLQICIIIGFNSTFLSILLLLVFRRIKFSMFSCKILLICITCMRICYTMLLSTMIIIMMLMGLDIVIVHILFINNRKHIPDETLYKRR